MVTKLVGILGEAQRNGYQSLFAALAMLYPVEFRQVASLAGEAMDALIVLDGRISEGVAAARRGLPAYVVAAEGSGTVRAASSELRFGRSDSLDVCLRGQVMSDAERRDFRGLAVEAGDEVLVCRDGHPVWLSRPAGTSRCQILSVPPPVLAQNELLFQHLNGERFLGLLALLNFLRGIVRETDWQDSPVRACFVFDDPSLYRPSYGFLDYRLLAEHATKHEFFVSVATIPLDTWWVDRAVASIFRAYSPRLSLIMHGNNHTAQELLTDNGGADHLQIAAQAIRRFERLELRHGVAGFRIMEAPHGAISYQIVEHLMSLGYEAVLCTMELLVRYNPTISWPVTLGMDRAELLGGGLPAITRIRMSPFWKNEVILATFLRKPFVVAGHHWDAAENFKTLEEIAKVINGLRSVGWGTPLDMARGNFKYIRHHDEFNLRLYSRTIHVRVPEGMKHLFVHRPWIRSGSEAETLFITASGREVFRGTGQTVVGPIPVESGEELDISSPPGKQLDFRTVKAPRVESWPVVRKILMEARDRSSPVRYKAMRLLRGASARVPGKKEDY